MAWAKENPPWEAYPPMCRQHRVGMLVLANQLVVRHQVGQLLDEADHLDTGIPSKLTWKDGARVGKGCWLPPRACVRGVHLFMKGHVAHGQGGRLGGATKRYTLHASEAEVPTAAPANSSRQPSPSLR